MPSVLDTVVQTLTQEFGDIADVGQALRVVLRLTLAAVLGGLLGWEREARGKNAGLRTHMLVAVGAAVFVLVPQQAGVEPADMSRVIQGVIAGVGFLCAGAILKEQGSEHVRGMTTAAGIWLTAAIGVAAGLGREATAALATLTALVILSLLPRLLRLHAPAHAGTRPAVAASDDTDAPPPAV